MTEERSDHVAPESDSPAGEGAPAEETIESLRAALEQANAQRLRAAADYQNQIGRAHV